MFCVSSRFISFLPHILATARHTSADLANISAEDTIRISASTTKLRPRYHEQQTTRPHSTPLFPESPLRYPSIKGLFQSGSSHTCLSIPSMCRTSNPLTVGIETSFPVADNGFATKHKQKVALRGWRRLVGSPGLLPVDPSGCQVVSTGSGLNVSDSTYSRVVTTFFYYRYASFPIYFDCLCSHWLFLSPSSITCLVKIPSTGPFLRRRTTSILFSSSSTPFNST